MTDAELTQFAELAKKYEPKDKEKVLSLIKADVHEVFQEINDGGRTAANKDNQKTKERLETELEAEKAKAKKAEADLAELNGKAPDAAKLKETYDRQVQDLQEAHKQELLKRDDTIKTTRRDVALGQLSQKLEHDFGIDPEYVSEVLIKREDVLNRFKPMEDGSVAVLKAGTDLPLVNPGDGKTVIDLLATELAGPVANKWKNSKVKRGSGTLGGGGSETPQGEQLYTEIRQEAKDRTEATTKQNQNRSTGYERLRSGSR